MARSREPVSSRPLQRLSPDERRELLRLIDAVPHGSTSRTPAVRALVEFIRSLKVPWYVPTSGTTYLRLDVMIEGRQQTAIECGLDLARRLADEEWK